MIADFKNFDLANLFKDLGGGVMQINMPIVPEDFPELVAFLAGHGVGGFAGLPTGKPTISRLNISELIWKNVFGSATSTKLSIVVGGVEVKCIHGDFTNRMIVEGFTV